jgi:hypothetical protein
MEDFVSRCGLPKLEFEIVAVEELSAQPEEEQRDSPELQGSLVLACLKVAVRARESDERKLKERLLAEVLEVIGEVAEMRGNRLRVKMKEIFDVEIPKSALMQAMVLWEKNGELEIMEEAVTFACTKISGIFLTEH